MGSLFKNEVPSRLIHLVRKRDRRVPSRSRIKNKKINKTAAVRFDSSSAHTVGQAPNNNNNTATAASDNNYYLVCQQQVHTRNSTSESHWSTSSYRQKQRRTKKIRSKYLDWKKIRLVVLGLVSSISNDLGAAGEIRCRVESTTQKKYRREFFKYGCGSLKPTTTKEISIQFVVDCTVKRYQRWRQTK